MKLLMISTDQKIFENDSAVARRMVEYARGYEELHIVVFKKGRSMTETSELSLSANCWVYSTRSFSKLTYPFDAIRLGRFIIERKGIGFITCQDPFLTAIAGLSLKRQFSLPIELQLHTDIGSPYFVKTFRNRFYKSLALSYIPKADHIRVVSNRIKDYLINVLNIKESKIEIRPIAVDFEKIKETPISTDLHNKYRQFKKIILVASRLEKEKNIILALESFKKVVDLRKDVGLLIVGEGSQLDFLKSKIDKLDISHCVAFEPWVEREILFSYYKTADLFLLTSFYEGYGMTLIEAQAAGCPIVSTDVGVAREAGATIVGYNALEVADAIVAKLT